ncbi:hypothetical protein [Halococcus salifodinae]|uniref:Uncharacterized protein n=1 Tax=Halococcus salifodinae DSM 8989 TaxID=1227456 RepID=M0NAB6_9EURY|nr:hypothetical protein [Halococcus salifodinae]EMA54498.1 hypothetical protein C450_05555 [Halococcus salifodinae DSM 8989]
MSESDCDLPTRSETGEQVEWNDRFAENIPSYLSEEETQARLRTGIERGLNALWEEHGRLTDIEIETEVHRSRLEPQCSYLEVEIEAVSVRWSR